MVTFTLQEGIFVLHLAGEININSLNDTRSKVEGFNIDQYERIIIDLSKVSFFDSSGLGYLVVLIKQVKVNKGTIVFCNPNNLVKRLLSTIRIDKYVSIFDNCDQAIQYMQAPPESSGTDQEAAVPDRRPPAA